MLDACQSTDSASQACQPQPHAGRWRYPSVHLHARLGGNNTEILFAGLSWVMALMRELVQNTIDGSRMQELQDGRRVPIAPTLRFEFKEISWEIAEALDVRNLIDHYNMCEGKCGPEPRLIEGRPVNMLLVEDNGIGLTGAITPPAQGETAGGAQKYTYEVYGAEGAQSKGGNEGGRWGVGGETAVHASALRASLASSTRDEIPRMFATGRSSLATRIKGDRKFLALGAFSSPEGDQDADGALPCEGEYAELLHDSIGFFRSKDDTGLSIAVIDPIDDVTPRSLVAAAFACVFPQIALGLISIEIHDARPGGMSPVLISRDTIRETLKEAPVAAILAEFAKREEKEFQVLGSLDEAICLLQRSDACLDRQAEFASGVLSFSDADKAEMRDAFETGEIIKFSAETSTVHNSLGVNSGRLEVVIQKLDGIPAGMDILIRDSIAIINKNDRGRFTVTTARQNALAVCLGDCEDPSHMNFIARQGKKRGWKAPEKLIGAFKNIAGDAIRLLVNVAEHVDKHCLESLFPIPGDGRSGPINAAEHQILPGTGEGEDDPAKDTLNGTATSSKRDREEPDDETLEPSDRTPGTRVRPVPIRAEYAAPGTIRVWLDEGVLGDDVEATKLAINFFYQGSKRLFDTKGITVASAVGCGRFEVINDGAPEVIFKKVSSQFSALVRGFDPKRNVDIDGYLEGEVQ